MEWIVYLPGQPEPVEEHSQLAGNCYPCSCTIAGAAPSGETPSMAFQVTVGGGPSEDVGGRGDEQTAEIAISMLADPQLGTPLTRLMASGCQAEEGPH